MKFIDRFEKIPVGTSGVALGFFGIINALIILLSNVNLFDLGPNVNFDPNNFRYFAVVISGILLICLLTKNFVHYKTFHKETKHNLMSSFIPTIFMTMMLFGGWIASYNNEVAHYIGAILWYIVVILHYLYLGWFVYHIILKHDWKNEHFYASWYVPPIGMVVSCTVFGPIFNTGLVPIEFFFFIWFTGFVNLLIMTPIIIYKTIFFANYKNEELGALGIFAAPSNLVLAGYISIFRTNHYFFGQNAFWGLLIFMMIMAIASTWILYIMLFKIFKNRFNPSWAALTFPFAISTTSNLLLAQVFSDTSIMRFFVVLSLIKLTFSLMLIIYITIRYYFLIIKRILNFK